MSLLEAVDLLTEKFPDRHYWNAFNQAVRYEQGFIPEERYGISVQPGLDSDCDIIEANTLEEAFRRAEVEWKVVTSSNEI